MAISNTYLVIVITLAMALLALNAQRFKLGNLRPVRRVKVLTRETLSPSTNLIIFVLQGREYAMLESSRHLSMCPLNPNDAAHEIGVLSDVSPDRRDLSGVSPDRRDLSGVSPDRRDLSGVSPDRRDLSLPIAVIPLVQA
jgi:hypothetical protein